MPRLSLSRPTVAQRYHLEVWAEKTTVDDVVEPIAGRFAFNYLAFAGQPGIKPCRELVDRAVRHGRPVRILYISDFDPQGESMPVAVARKIEFVGAERGLDLDIRLIPIVLTAQQCVDLKLPRAPIKDGDRGRSTFEERHGEGATELDALEALHPGLLHDLLVAEVERYHDATLNERVDERFEELSAEAQQLADNVVPRFDGDLAALSDELADLRKQLDPISQAARADPGEGRGLGRAGRGPLEGRSPRSSMTRRRISTRSNGRSRPRPKSVLTRSSTAGAPTSTR